MGGVPPWTNTAVLWQYRWALCQAGNKNIFL